jgi:hypothetical protein
MICAPGTSLSAGGTGSLLGAYAPVGSPLPRTPAGVSCLPLQSYRYPSTQPYEIKGVYLLLFIFV